MASSVIQIYNMALSHVGVATLVAAPDEDSAEAEACTTFYDTLRESLLRLRPWPFATRFLTMALVEADPTSEWSYSYRYPTDCLMFRRVLNPMGRSSRVRVPHILGTDDQGILVYTDEQNAQCEITSNVTDSLRFDSQFSLGLSWGLAAHIAPRVTGGDPHKLGANATKQFGTWLSIAAASAANEIQVDPTPDSEFISYREG